MRRTLFVIGLCACVLSASAQFKVQSDGKIAIQTTSTALSPISINGAGSSSNYISCYTTGKSGINMSVYGGNGNTIYGGNFSVSNATQPVGLRGSSSGGTTCFGVMGIADGTTKTIGLWGNIGSYCTTGAAVYGTVYGDLGTALTTNAKYAGFFNGNVKATGSIVASTTIQGALLGESSSGTGSSSMSLRSLSIANSLASLNVTTYQKEHPALPDYTETIYKLDGDSTHRGETQRLDIMDEQFYEKSHYALDANQLEEIFPDLVYVKADGSKSINYMEMIPLLVQSINELNAEIEVLKGQNPEARTKAASRAAESGKESFTSKNKLYQNTPNPFKETTTIRFSLADDVQSATICIFDMTGKTIKKLPISSGMESVSIGGYELGEGMFLYSLIVNGQEIDTKRMIISK